MCFAVPAVRPRVDELNGVCLWLVRSCLLLLNLSKSSEWNACRSAAVSIRSICCNPILIRFHFLHYSMQFIHCRLLCSSITYWTTIPKSHPKSAYHVVKKSRQWNITKPQWTSRLMRFSCFSALHWDIYLIQKRPHLNRRVSFCFLKSVGFPQTPIFPSNFCGRHW